MSSSFQIGDVIQLKPPLRGAPSSIQDQLFSKVSEYADFIRGLAYSENPPEYNDRLLLVLEIFEGTLGCKLRAFPLTPKTETSKTCFLDNAISIKQSNDEDAMEYIAVPISVNAMEDWIEEKIAEIPHEVAKELAESNHQLVIGQDPRDVAKEDDEDA